VALTEIDRNLLKRCVSEDPGAWRNFVDRFIGLFVHVINHAAHARSVTSKPQDVDDLCAEVFLALVADDYKILRNFRGNSSLATYLTVVSRRIVVREMSRRKMAEALGHVNAQSVGSERVERVAAERVAAEQSRIEDREEVEQMLTGLSVGDAEVVRQFHLEGKSYQEISEGMGLAENTIGPTLSRARQKLRERKIKS
jgi:RNA polymerase sigma-70 factor (ECF subfamily)